MLLCIPKISPKFRVFSMGHIMHKIGLYLLSVGFICVYVVCIVLGLTVPPVNKYKYFIKTTISCTVFPLHHQVQSPHP